VNGNLAKELVKYTYKDYLTWDDKIRYELINGTAYALASPTRTHQRISMELSGLIWQFLRGKLCEVFHAPFDVRLNADDFDDIVVQPDIIVVCDESKHDGKSLKGAPDMVVEILSPSNSLHDIVTKFKLYQNAGVREYWIVDPNTKMVQVYIINNGKYDVGSIYRDDDIIPIHVLKGCKINLADIFQNADETEIDGNQIINKSKLINVLKECGINDNQIEKIINNKNLY